MKTNTNKTMAVLTKIANISILLILMLFLCGYSECEYENANFDIPDAYRGTYTAESASTILTDRDYDNTPYEYEIDGTVDVSVEGSSTVLKFVNLSAYFGRVFPRYGSEAIQLKFNGTEKERTIQQNENDLGLDKSQRRYLFEACMKDVLRKESFCVNCFFVIEDGTRYLIIQMDPPDVNEVYETGYVRLKKTS